MRRVSSAREIEPKGRRVVVTGGTRVILTLNGSKSTAEALTSPAGSPTGLHSSASFLTSDWTRVRLGRHAQRQEERRPTQAASKVSTSVKVATARSLLVSTRPPLCALLPSESKQSDRFADLCYSPRTEPALQPAAATEPPPRERRRPTATLAPATLRHRATLLSTSRQGEQHPLRPHHPRGREGSLLGTAPATARVLKKTTTRTTASKTTASKMRRTTRCRKKSPTPT